MSNKLSVIKPKKIVRILKKLGFEERRQTGSHLIFRHPESKKIIPIPIHNKDLKKGTLLNILKQAGISKKEFLKLK